MKRKLVLMVLLFLAMLFIGCNFGKSKEYNVRYEENGGSLVEDYLAQDGEDIKLPSITKEGYEFLGWYLDSSFTKRADNEKVNGDITLYAKWEIKTYTVTIDGEKKTVEYGKTIDLTSPEKQGYNFLGWYLDKEFTKKWNNEKVTEDITLYPKYEIKKFRVVLDGKTIEVEYGATLSNEVQEKVGYSFSGWYLDNKLTNKWEGTVESNITLYSKYEKNKYVVKFSGTTLSDIEVEYKGKIEEPKYTKEGYSIDGWYIDSELTTKWNFGKDKVESNVTLYPKYIARKYPVTFEEGQTIELEYNSLVEEPTEPTKTGYTFIGWYKDSSLTQKWDFNSDKVLGITKIYIKWEINKYLVTFSEYEELNVKVEYNSLITKPTNPTKSGYSFSGWYLDSALKTSINFSTYKVNSDITLYAKWTKNSSGGGGSSSGGSSTGGGSSTPTPTPVTKYTVTYNTNGGSSIVDESVASGSKLTLKTPTREGYKFLGWYSDEALTNEWKFDTNTVTTNVTLYAKWEIIVKHKVTFSGYETKEIASGEKVNKLEINVEKGKHLVGWFIDSSFNYEWNFDVDKVTKDIVLYPCIKLNEYKVTFSGYNSLNQTVEYDKLVTKPSNPEEDEKEFIGWYKDSEKTQAWNFDVDKVESDITLYPKFEVKKYQVKFDGYETKEIASGEKVNKLEINVEKGKHLVGWFIDSSFNYEWNFDVDKVTKDIVLYPCIKLNEYKVTFSGYNSLNQTVEYDSLVTKPSNPEVLEKTFVGWYSDEALTKEWDFSSKVESDITLYPKFEVKKYQVKFDGYETKEIASGEKVNKLEINVEKGKHLVGWFIDSSFNYEWNFDVDKVTKDIVLYPCIKLNEYKVTFSGYNSLNQTVEYDKLVTKPSNPEEDEKEFIGWYKDSEKTQAWNFDVDKVESDITLYPKFATIEYLVKFNGYSELSKNENQNDKITKLNLATVSYVVGTYKMDGKLAELKGNNGMVTKDVRVEQGQRIDAPEVDPGEGKEFVGWYIDEDCTIPWNFNYDTVNGDLVLYPYVRDMEYQIRFNGYNSFNGKAPHGSKIDKPTDPSEPGKTFKGWYTDPDCTNPWDFTNGKVTANITLYPKWEIVGTNGIVYTISGNQVIVSGYTGKDKEVVILSIYEGLPVVKIATNAFLNNTTIEVIEIPSSIKEIEKDAFKGCTSLKIYCESNKQSNWSDGWNSDCEVIWESNKEYTITFDVTKETIKVKNNRLIPQHIYEREGYKFIGWYKDAEFKEEWNFATDKVTKDITLYAKLEANQYTIKFNNADYKEEKGKHDDLITKPADPKKTGYTFDGWYKDSACTVRWDFDNDKVSGNTNLYAGFSKIKYTVKFNNTDYEDRKVKYGEFITKPNDPVKTGYTFDGWYKDSACTVRWDFDKDKVLDNVTLYAKFNKIEYTIKFNGTDILDLVVAHNGLVTKPSDPKKDGYTFDGWYKDSDYTVLWDFNNDSVLENVKLFAKFIKNKYIVKFSGVELEDQEAEYDTLITIPDTPIKTGYTFDGWYKNSDYTVRWDFTNDKVTGNIIIYAKFIKNEYNVSFNGTDIEDIKVKYNDPITKPSDPVKTGYTFIGWYKDSDYTVLWDFANDKVLGNVTLYAKFIKNEYSVSFNGADIEDIKVEYDSLITKPSDSVRNGYTFIGWYKNSDYKDEWNFATDKVTENVTLYAKWEINKYSVKFSGAEVEDKEIEYNSLITKPTDPSKTGYTFGGWYKDSGLTVLWDFANDKVLDNVTLYAKFVINEYNVKFNGYSDLDTKVEYDSLVTKPSDLVKTGYTFIGWYKDSEYKVAWDFAKDKVTENTTLYAKFDINVYEVKFNGYSDLDTKVEYNSLITKPSDPTQTGYTFIGWYKDSEYKVAWDFAKDKVVENTTLYAKFDINKYEVKFNGYSDLDTKVEYNSLITKPSDPVQTGYTFIGWYKDSEYKNEWNFAKDKVEGSITLYAKFTINKYNVKFEGTELKDIEVEYDSLITKPTDPIKTGYTFIGWYKDSEYKEAWNFAQDKVEGSITLYAKFEINKYNVKFDGYDSLNVEVVYDSLITKPTDPIKTDYIFVGWYKDSEYKDEWNFAQDKVDGSITLYAKFSKNVSIVKFSGADIQDMKVENNSLITKPTDPVKDGHTFVGWYKDSEYKEAWNFAQDKVTSDITLYAKFTINKYNVKFSGTELKDIEVEYDSLITKPTNPVKDGHTFVGWYKDSEFKEAWNFAQDKVTIDVTIYAKFTINKYNVKFEGYDSLTKEVEYDSLITKPTDPVKDGHTFVGWYKDSEYKEAWDFATDKVLKNITLYAKFTINKYNVKFSGTELKDIEVEYDSLITKPTNPVKDGHTFVGWYKDSEYKDEWNFAQDKVTIDVTIYAKFTINKYNVKFEGYDSLTKEVEYDSLITKPTDPVKDGHTFVGWYKDSEFKEAWNFATDKIEGSITLYAKFTINKYNVKFSGAELKDVEVEYDSLITKPADPIKIDHIFDGWYKDSEYKVEWNFATDKVTENTTLYAKWYESTEGLVFILNANKNSYNVSKYNGKSVNVVIPSKYKGLPVTSIGASAFVNCKTVESVKIPNSVTSIGNYAFEYCDSLVSIEIPDSVKIIGRNAFYDCGALENVTIGNSVTSIDNSTFANCDSLVSIEIPDSVEIIGSRAFYSCKSLENVTIGNSTTTIEDHVFYSCGSLKNVTIGNSVTFIGDYAFAYCISLKNVIIPNSIENIGYRAFYICNSLVYNEYDNGLYLGNSDNKYLVLVKTKDSNITSITINENTKCICSYALEICLHLTTIDIPSNVMQIDEWAFHYCTALTSINVNENNKYYCSIDGNLYSKDKTMLIQYAVGKKETLFVVPDSVKHLGACVFEYSKSLKTIEIPMSVEHIGERAFFSCTALTSINVNENNKYYCSIDGNLYSKDKTMLIQYAIGKTEESFVMPSNVITIEECAFEFAKSLKYVSIGKNVTSIGRYAFYSCSSLETINIPSGVSQIQEYTFYNCRKLDNVVIPNSVRTISRYAFANCTSLKKISLSNYITYIYEYAFCNCTSLASITLPNNLTSIGYNAFENCKSLTSITLPARVTKIGSGTFADCISLKDITILGEVTEILGYAFGNCKALTSIEIPDSVKYLEEGAFYDCSSLTIYCEAITKPDRWNIDWNISNCPVVWNMYNKLCVKLENTDSECLYVKKGDLIVLNKMLKKDGFVFAGLYKDSALTKEWNFEKDAVLEEMTLYVKWVESDSTDFIVSAINNKFADYITGNKKVNSDLVLPSSIYGVGVSWSSGKTYVLSNTGKYTKPQGDTSVTYNISYTFDKETTTYSITLLVAGYSIEEMIEYLLTDGVLKDINNNKFAGNISLPSKDDKFGIHLYYVSSNPNAITDEGVISSSLTKDTEVIITVTASYDDANCEEGKFIESFEIKVIASAASNDVSKINEFASTHEQLRHVPYGKGTSGIEGEEERTFVIGIEEGKALKEEGYVFSGDENFRVNEDGSVELITQYFRYHEANINVKYGEAIYRWTINIGIGEVQDIYYIGGRSMLQASLNPNERGDMLQGFSKWDNYVGIITNNNEREKQQYWCGFSGYTMYVDVPTGEKEVKITKNSDGSIDVVSLDKEKVIRQQMFFMEFAVVHLGAKEMYADTDGDGLGDTLVYVPYIKENFDAVRQTYGGNFGTLFINDSDVNIELPVSSLAMGGTFADGEATATYTKSAIYLSENKGESIDIVLNDYGNAMTVKRELTLALDGYRPGFVIAPEKEGSILAEGETGKYNFTIGAQQAADNENNNGTYHMQYAVTSELSTLWGTPYVEVVQGGFAMAFHTQSLYALNKAGGFYISGLDNLEVTVERYYQHAENQWVSDYVVTDIKNYLIPLVDGASGLSGVELEKLLAKAIENDGALIEFDKLTTTTLKEIFELKERYDSLRTLWKEKEDVKIAGERINAIIKAAERELELLGDLGPDGLAYSLNDDKESYRVIGYYGSSTSVVIPSTYKGLVVNTIASNVFSDATFITNIYISENVENINLSFASCYSLTNIDVDENNEYYTSIDGNLYSKDKKTLIQYAIGKTNTSFEIPSSVENISEYAFNICTSLKSITISSNVKNINDHPFFRCESLTNISVDENNEYFISIDGNLYSKDKKILIQYAIGKTDTSFVIPDGVENIGEYAFSFCSNLKKVIIPNSVKQISKRAFHICRALTEVKMGNNVESIGEWAFNNCILLNGITIPKSVENMGEKVFNDCVSLTIYCGADSKPTGWDDNWNNSNCDVIWNFRVVAFNTNGGSYVSTIYVTYNGKIKSPASTKSGYVISGWYKDSNLTEEWNFDEDTVTRDIILYAKWVEGTEGLEFALNSDGKSYSVTGYTGTSTSLIIPSEYNGLPVTSISRNAFNYSASVESITIPESIKNLDQIFSILSSLSKVYYDGTIESWCNVTITSASSSSSFAFYMKDSNGEYKEVNEVIIPDTITRIGFAQFYGFNNIKSIIISESVRTINSGALANCTSLTSIKVDENNKYFTSIDGNLYSKDKKTLVQYAVAKTDTSFVIPDGVERINTGAFRNSTSLTSITIPKSLLSIGNTVFYRCASLDKVYYEGALTDWCNIEFYGIDSNPMYSANSFYMKDSNDEWKEVTEITIPNSITRIGRYQFAGFNNVTEVIIPNSVESIDNGAFENCKSLKYNEYDGGYYLGNSDNKYLVLVEVKDTKVTSFTINSSTKIISSGAFSNCRLLTSITIPSSIEYIAMNGFVNCRSLDKVYYEGTLVDWCNIEFDNYYSNPMRYANSFYMRDSNSEWKEVTEIVIPSAVENIGNYQFAGFNNVKSIEIPNSLERIGQGAFYNCVSLKNIVISKSVTYIGINAFSDCASLTIYCETETKPTNWNYRWNSSNCEVVWNAKIVTLETNGGTEISNIIVVGGGDLDLPSPTKSGFTFIGWYKDSALTNEWDFSNDKVTENVTLYAKWVNKTLYTIELKNADLAPLLVYEDELIPEITTSIVDGKVVVGWYKDSALTDEWDFSNDKVTEGITLYAKWLPLANGTYSYVASSYSDRTEILGALEKYVVESNLTGISLYENSSYELYNPLVVKGSENYIPGYGFGVLKEGKANGDLEAETNAKWKRYYHSYITSNPKNINYGDDKDETLGELANYIFDSFWDTKMNDTKDGYQWINALANEKPQAQNASSVTGLATKYKFEVKIGSELKYNTLSSNENLSKFAGQQVKIEDYLTPWKLLYTKANGWARGTASLTGSGSIKGLEYYYNNSSDGYNAEAWAKVGLKAYEENGKGYLEIEFNQPCSAFYAMYYINCLSYETEYDFVTFYSPIPEEFIDAIGGAKYYGKFDEENGLTPVDTTLATGPYVLEEWDQDNKIVFKKNEFYHNDSLYQGWEGVHIAILPAITEDTEAAYREFEAGKLTSCSVPNIKLQELKDDPRASKTVGSNTTKLNLNVCDQETWEKLFGVNGTITQTEKADYWQCEPIMSNDDFLRGLSYSIDRADLASLLGRSASGEYFGSSYLSDPENGISYNSTQAHKDATKALLEGTDGYGYSLALAKQYFKKASEDLIASGVYKEGDKITLEMAWQTEAMLTTQGKPMAEYITTAFNSCGGGLTLEIENIAVAIWSDVYYKKMMVGQFDMVVGGINGNTLNPINFLEVLKSDNSSGFTFNWGIDTSVPSKDLVWNNQVWSFDALWQAAETGCYVEDGKIKASYAPELLSSKKNDDGTATIQIKANFIKAEGIDIEITDTLIYGYLDTDGRAAYSEDIVLFSYNEETDIITVTVSAELYEKYSNDYDSYTEMGYFGIDIYMNLVILEIDSAPISSVVLVGLPE